MLIYFSFNDNNSNNCQEGTFPHVSVCLFASLFVLSGTFLCGGTLLYIVIVCLFHSLACCSIWYCVIERSPPHSSPLPPPHTPTQKEKKLG